MKIHSGRPKRWELEAARQALEQGEPQRALQHLARSCLGAGYDCEYFELMGMGLLGTGGVINAGRFFFVSGVRRPEHSEAIKRFLKAHHNRFDFRQLQSQLPMCARVFWKLSQFPPVVAADLRILGWPEGIQAAIGAGRSRGKQVR